MARRGKMEMWETYSAWKDRLVDPEFRLWTYKKQGEEFGVSDQTISNWLKEVKSEDWDEILEKSRKNTAKAAAQVDSAMLKKALEGDVPAMKLWKESIEGWSPRTINDNINRNADLEGKTEAELRAEILKGVPKEELAAALKDKEIRVVEPGEAVNGDINK